MIKYDFKYLFSCYKLFGKICRGWNTIINTTYYIVEVFLKQQTKNNVCPLLVVIYNLTIHPAAHKLKYNWVKNYEVLKTDNNVQDTAGQERYRTITTAYYRGAMGFLLMYDITNQDSFSTVQDWWVTRSLLSILHVCTKYIYHSLCIAIRATQIKTYSWDNAQVILVGNKCDLEDDRLVTTEDGLRLADELGEPLYP